MIKSKDAFGMGLIKHMDGSRYTEVLERDDGNIQTLLNGEYFTGYKQWAQYEKDADKLAKGKVLDIGCGAGRHSLYLQGKGHKVLGIDNSPLAVSVCRKRGLKRVLELPLEKLSAKLGKFNTILMLGANFGLFQNASKLKSILRKMYVITPPDGILMAESMDPRATKNKDHLQYHKKNIIKGRLPGQIRMRIRLNRIIGPWFDYLFASKKDMVKLLENTGWKVEKFIDSPGPIYVAIIVKTP